MKKRGRGKRVLLPSLLGGEGGGGGYLFFRGGIEEGKKKG